MLYWACDYLSMLGLKLNHVGKKGHCYFEIACSYVLKHMYRHNFCNRCNEY